MLERVSVFPRNVERSGFHGPWVTNAFARGRPTLDPLVRLGALATQTNRIELVGACCHSALITSVPPMYGRRASGTMIDPSAC